MSIGKQDFERLVRDITVELGMDVKYTDPALEALRESAEAFLEGVFHDANDLASSRNSDTVDVQDMNAVRRMWNIRRPARDRAVVIPLE